MRRLHILRVTTHSLETITDGYDSTGYGFGGEDGFGWCLAPWLHASSSRLSEMGRAVVIRPTDKQGNQYKTTKTFQITSPPIQTIIVTCSNVAIRRCTCRWAHFRYTAVANQWTNSCHVTRLNCAMCEWRHFPRSAGGYTTSAPRKTAKWETGRSGRSGRCRQGPSSRLASPFLP